MTEFKHKLLAIANCGLTDGQKLLASGHLHNPKPGPYPDFHLSRFFLLVNVDFLVKQWDFY